MKARWNKIFCMLMAPVIAAGGFAACGNNSNQAAGKVTIEILTWHNPESSPYYKGYEEAAEAYMAEHKDVDIKIRYEDDDTYGSILETGFAGGTAPDLIQLKSGQRATYKENLLDLREHLTKSSAYDNRNEEWAENFVGGLGAFPVEEGADNNNSILFVPNDGNPEVYTGGLYVYNKKLIQDAGLDPENPPKNWTELFEWLEVLKETDGVEPIAGSSDVGGKVSQFGSLFGEGYADKFFDAEVADPGYSDDLFWDKVYVLTSYDQGDGMPLDNLPYYGAMFGLMKQHLSYYQASWTENSYETETLSFANANTAMIVSNYWSYDTLVNSITENKFPDGYGIFQSPVLGEDTLDYAVAKGWITQDEADRAAPGAVTRLRSSSGTGQHDYGFSVNGKLKDDPDKLETVIDFLQYFSSKEAQEKYVETAGSLSPVKDVKIIENLKSFIIEEPAEGFSKNVLGYFVIEWGNSDWDVTLLKYINGETSWEEAVEAISDPVWAGDIPALEALEEAVGEAQTALDGASDDEIEEAQAALTFASLRYKLYHDYYYNMTGNLTEIN